MGRPTIFDSATPDATSWKRPLRPLLSWLVCRFASCSESAYATHTAAVIDVNQIRNVFTGISFYAQRQRCGALTRPRGDVPTTALFDESYLLAKIRSLMSPSIENPIIMRHTFAVSVCWLLMTR